jgi:hypothetical protein
MRIRNPALKITDIRYSTVVDYLPRNMFSYFFTILSERKNWTGSGYRKAWRWWIRDQRNAFFLFRDTSPGYCIYFDRKRRSHPDFRRKLREKRKAAARSGAGSSGFAMPDLSDGEAVQRFFLQVLWPPETESLNIRNDPNPYSGPVDPWALLKAKRVWSVKRF